eukprot:130840_1
MSTFSLWLSSFLHIILLFLYIGVYLTHALTQPKKNCVYITIAEIYTSIYSLVVIAGFNLLCNCNWCNAYSSINNFLSVLYNDLHYLFTCKIVSNINKLDNPPIMSREFWQISLIIYRLPFIIIFICCMYDHRCIVSEVTSLLITVIVMLDVFYVAIVVSNLIDYTYFKYHVQVIYYGLQFLLICIEYFSILLFISFWSITDNVYDKYAINIIMVLWTICMVIMIPFSSAGICFYLFFKYKKPLQSIWHEKNEEIHYIYGLKKKLCKYSDVMHWMLYDHMSLFHISNNIIVDRIYCVYHIIIYHCNNKHIEFSDECAAKQLEYVSKQSLNDKIQYLKSLLSDHSPISAQKYLIFGVYIWLKCMACVFLPSVWIFLSFDKLRIQYLFIFAYILLQYMSLIICVLFGYIIYIHIFKIELYHALIRRLLLITKTTKMMYILNGYDFKQETRNKLYESVSSVLLVQNCLMNLDISTDIINIIICYVYEGFSKERKRLEPLEPLVWD